VAETKRKIRLHFLAHLQLNLVLGSAKRLSHGFSQKAKSPIVEHALNDILVTDGLKWHKIPHQIQQGQKRLPSDRWQLVLPKKQWLTQCFAGEVDTVQLD